MTELGVSVRPAPNGWSCNVTVHATSTTEHRVHVARDDLARLAPGATDPADLVRRAFEFMLEREPNTSILREFDLPVIGRYFPEFEREITSDREVRTQLDS